MSPPPPPPPPPLFRTLASPEASSSTAGIESGGGGSSISLSPSLLIIAAILAFVFVASASIHLLLRYLSRPSSPSSRAVHHHRSSSSSGDGAAVAAAAAALEHSEKEKSALIESLPLFTLASSLAALPKSSPDCAVCLSPFQPDAELRLLPACRHAFHADCIDTWLRSTPSCPLCRASIALPHPPILQTPRSGSFRIEIGSISLRRTPPEANSATAASGTSLPPPPPALPPPPSHLRSYSIGSYDYFVEEEVEAVVPRNPKEKKPAEVRAPTTFTVAGAPAAPGEEVAEEAGGAGRAWLKDYVDRLASTASSSFSSLRFSGQWSGRWSHRFDGGGAPDSWWWDLEGNQQQQQQQQREGEEAGYYTLYRWLVGI